MNDKKEIIRLIKIFRRKLKHEGIILRVRGDWDIHRKEYANEEIAARFLRKQGYAVEIIESDNTQRPAYEHGYIRFYRYAKMVMYKGNMKFTPYPTKNNDKERDNA